MEENDHVVNDPITFPLHQNKPHQYRGSQLIHVLENIGIQDIPKAIQFLANRLIVHQKKENIIPDQKHSWDTYELSQEILNMAPKERKEIYGNYKTMMEDILQDKYQ